MNIEFVYLRSGREDWLEDFLQIYEKKISHFFPFQVKAIRSPNYPRQKSKLKLEEESQLILSLLEKEDWLIVFDEKGQVSKDSIDFSHKLSRTFELGKKKYVFVIGGAFGLSEAVKARANQSLSFSKLTFSHHTALVVAMEQLYRALTIWKGVPYHNA